MTGEPAGKSEKTVELRQKTLQGCEQLIWDFFNSGGQVVIYDANNGTKEKRQEIAEKAEKMKIHIVFLGTSIQFLWKCCQFEQW